MQRAIKAIELAKVFKGKQKTTYLKLIKDKAIEDVEQFLTDELPYVCPTPVTVFIINEDETNIPEINFSNLRIQSNEIHVIFDNKVFIYNENENETDITEIYFSNLGIQSNEIYVTFDDKDLYDKTPTQGLNALKESGIKVDAFGLELT